MNCSKCGSVIPEGKAFCGFCGTHVEGSKTMPEAAPEDRPSHEPPRPKRRLPGWAWGVVAFIAVLCLSGALLGTGLVRFRDPVFHGALGSWEGTDGEDGSRQYLVVTHLMGYRYEADLYDEADTICSLAEEQESIHDVRFRGAGWASSDRLKLSMMQGDCLDHPDAARLGIYRALTLIYDPSTDRIQDGGGGVWIRSQ